MKTKHIKGIIILVITFFLVGIATAQNPRKTEVKIKSTVECEKCKKNIETKIGKLKGVRKVVADYNTHEITVIFNSRRISLEEIKKAITEMGYDADEMKAQNKLQQLEHKKLQEKEGSGK